MLKKLKIADFFQRHKKKNVLKKYITKLMNETFSSQIEVHSKIGKELEYKTLCNPSFWDGTV